MILFQWLAVPALVIIALLDIRAFVASRRVIFILREVVWSAAILLICFPQLSSWSAGFLGIGRGADLVVYAFMLASTVFMFHLYGRNYTLRRDLVELARREAISTAIRIDSPKTKPNNT